MTRNRAVSLACCVLAVAVACGRERAGRGKLTLRFHPPAGASRQYAIEQQTTMRFEGGPMEQMGQQQMTMRMFVTQTHTGPTEGGLGVAVTFDSTTLEAPGVQGGQMNEALRRMRGLKGELVMDERMRVVRATFSDPAGAPLNAAQQLGSSVRGMAFPLPEQAVGVGDSWTEEIELPVSDLPGSPGPVRASTTLTVREIQVAGDDTTVVLDVVTTLPTDPINVTIQGRQASFRLAGTLAGSQEFSLTHGMQLGSELAGVVRMTMSGGAIPGAPEMTLVLDQRTTMRTVATP